MTDQTTTTNRMTLGSIRSGPRPAPDRIFLAGVEKIGKSTFAAGAPSPIFVAAEDGIRNVLTPAGEPVPAFPEPETFDEALAALRTLYAEEHPYRTVVVDTLDWVEPLIWAKLFREHGWANIEEPGYGKGYVVALTEWRHLLQGLDALRAKRGMEVILLAHTQVKVFSNPTGPDYSRYVPALSDRAANIVKAWADSNLFAIHEEFVKEVKGQRTGKGVSTGRRVVKTQRTAAWDAGNRWNLPPELPLCYADYAAARAAGAPADPEKLAEEAEVLVKALAPDKAKEKEIRARVKACGKDAAKLAQAVDRLRTLVAEKEAE